MGLAAWLSLIVVPADAATVVTLSDLNSTAQIEIDTSRGMYSWTVDGIESLKQQWFWYRVGDSSLARSIDSLPATYTTTANTVTITYVGAGFEIDVNYTLFGGTPGSLTADISETVRIRNTGTGTLNFHFFQFSDFDLGGASGDWVEIDGGVLARQWDGADYLAESTVLRSADRWQIGDSATILDQLNNTAGYNLTNVAGPLLLTDAAWAFQWDFSIEAGKSVLIGKHKQVVVPEPATMGLLALGGMALAAGRRYRRHRRRG